MSCTSGVIIAGADESEFIAKFRWVIDNEFAPGTRVIDSIALSGGLLGHFSVYTNNRF